MSAPNTEQILLVVDVQANNARLVELQKQLIENKTALAGLNQGFKEGRVSVDDLAAGQQRLGVATKQTQGEIAALTKANNDQTAANAAGAGSIAQLRAQLALGTAAYNKLSQEERDNSAAGQKLQATNKGLSDQLKTLEKAVGDTRRSVGDYNTGIKDVNVVSGKLTDGLRTAADKGLSPFKAQIEQGTGLLGKFKSGNELVSQGLGLLKGAGETGSLGFKAIAGGIALTGIGLFVIAISAVVTYFTQTAEGGKILAGVLGGLGAVVQVATDTVTTLGKALVYAVTHPLESITNLGNALTNALLHPIDTARGLGKAVGDLGTRIGEAAKAGQALVLEQKALVVARRELEIEDVKEQSRVNVLLRLSKERGKSATDQLAALKEAGRIEAELTEKSIKLQEREADAIKTAIRLKGAGKAADLKAELGAKQKEIAQTLASQDETNAKIRVRESVFVQKQQQDAKNAAKAARDAALQAAQDRVKDRQTQIERELLNVTKGSEAELVLKQRAVVAERDLALLVEKQTQAEKALIRATARVKTKQLEEDFNAKALEDAKKHDAATVVEANREYAEALVNLENYLNDKRAATERDLGAGLIGESEAQKRLNALEKAGLAAQMVINDDYRKDNAKANKAAADLEIKEQNRVKDQKKRIKAAEQGITEAAFAVTASTSDAVIELFGAETAAGQAALVIKKTVALAEIAIGVEKQVAANAVAGAKISAEAPPVTIPLGVAYTVATDALAIAGGIAGAAKIAGFNSGGYVSGPGTGTSDSIPARLSNGEAVINAQSVAMFRPLLSHLNELGGGVPFAYAAGGIAGQRAGAAPDGGLLARALGNTAGIDYNQLARVMSAHPTIVQVKDIAAAQARYVQPRTVSTLGG